jgi:hypothetical protein
LRLATSKELYDLEAAPYELDSLLREPTNPSLPKEDANEDPGKPIQSGLQRLSF